MRTCKDPKSPKDLRTHLKDHQDLQDPVLPVLSLVQ
jgi:hypothetical protein